ncbi:hypothetical protein BCR39DRAFT_480017 [Naematelia encephala]|uniref:Uncharacterized protein n=1 Tax=Naematelia encephala TaxID=71784 RepID=A0A1Y2B973_9TREE|nr:hypothetical protein BCR39DRAFT_480017 [Naematelia encephala]
MTTSITDARFTSLHFTPGHLASVSFDEPPETGWGVMPGYDESLPIPPHLEPPGLDADETLPSQIHPSYPFGRPPTISRPQRPWMSGPTNLLGTVGQGMKAGDGGISHWARGEIWDELGLGQVVEPEEKREVPPGMAGAKRPPSPPSPALHPTAAPAIRSQHLQRLYDRQRQTTPTAPADPFDAPVPNETYADEDVQQQNAAARGEATGQVGGARQGADDEDGDGEMGDAAGDMGS